MINRDIDREETTRRLAAEYREKEELAQRLRQEATGQWQKAIEGMIAFPAALTLGFASTAMYVASAFARGFEAFSATATRMRREQRWGEDEEKRGISPIEQRPGDLRNPLEGRASQSTPPRA